jgi:hypothetical protein
MAMEGLFAPSMWGGSTFPNDPLLSTYKRRPLSSSRQQHNKEKSTTLEHHSKGLGPI